MTTLAIDQGTTSTRALAFDRAGSARLVGSLEHRQSYPSANRVEHDPEELIRNIHACLSAAEAIDDLNAVGLDNQGESCLAWNADTGEALSPVIVWQDSRTAEVTERLKADGAEPFVRERAGLPLDPYFSATKLAWVVQELPEARRLADKGKLRLGTTDAFFLDRLAGRFVTDITTASRTSLMNLDTGAWDPELCRLFGVPMAALPRIVPTTGEFGILACGKKRVLLSASIVDQQASLYGHGCRKAGDAKITFGTGAFTLKVTDRLERAAGGALPTVAWQKSGENPVYALDGGVYCASAAINWARELGLFRDYAEVSSFEKAPAIERGLAFVPALAGLACPHWDRAARGTWLGLSLDTNQSDMIQAVLEGVALRTAEVTEAMERSGPLGDPVSIDGGMTANRYFCQFLADVLQRTIIVSDQPELTAKGTAALAAEAIGAPLAKARSGTPIVPRTQHDGARQKFAAAITAAKVFSGAP